MVPWSLQVFGKSTLSLNPLKLAHNSLSSFKNQFQADEPYSPCIYSLSSVESKLFEHSVMFYTHGFPTDTPQESLLNKLVPNTPLPSQ